MVLDEADRMVEAGFVQQVEKVKRAIRPGHQTLMFSATMPEDLSRIKMLKDGYVMKDCVGKAQRDQTNSQVTQCAVVAPVEEHLSVLHSVIGTAVDTYRRTQEGQSSVSHLAYGGRVDDMKPAFSSATRQALAEWEIVDTSGFRIMIFAPCNHYVDYIANFLSGTTKFEICAIHGNLSQGKRTRAYDTFLARGNTILCTSDASARGLDFPDVTVVIQVGFNARAEYIHRIGRTGRAGKQGMGVVILDDKVESSVLTPKCPENIMEQIPRTNVTKYDPVAMPHVSFQWGGEDKKSSKQVLRAWIGAYAGRWRSLRWNPHEVADMCYRFAKALGVGDEPGIMNKIREKLHIK